MTVLNHKIKPFHYFEEICAIPRGSYHEEQIADYLEHFAQLHDLKYKRDQMHNVVIYAPATKGFAKKASVMLQAHTDMVCDKIMGSTHDFMKDPIDLIVKKGFVTAKGTTLGADDGAGVALMLALLDDDSYKHPALECVFTVQEEVGLFGAMGLDSSWISAKRMISLDGDVFGQTEVSSCGGRDMMIRKTMHRIENEDPVYSLKISGLLGGHSGDAINKERANANVLMARILKECIDQGIDCRIVDIEGGSKENAITREAEVLFASQTSSDRIEDIVKNMLQAFKEEYKESDRGIKGDLTIAEGETCFSFEDSEALITFMFMMPYGVLSYSAMIPDLPTASLNMGVVKIEDDLLNIIISVRATLSSKRDEICNRIGTLAFLYGMSVDEQGDYDGWDFDPHSSLRKALKKSFKSYFKEEIKEEATHGGLETGIFKGKIPDLDIVTLGANAIDIHTPEERLELKSLENVYEFLKYFLETL